MNTISYLKADNQDFYLWFFLDPNSKQAMISVNNHPVIVPKFGWKFNPSELFDLSQDPPVINYEAFIKKWPFLADSTLDLTAVKYPDSDSRPGNPHNFANILAIFTLSGNSFPAIRDDSLVIRTPTLSVVPSVTPPQPTPKPKLTKKKARVRRLDLPPPNVVKEGKTLDLWACWLRIYRQMYFRSRWGPLQDMPHYPRKTSRTGRYYFCGNAYLARLCGLDEWTVRQILKQLEFENLIYTRYHGFKGRGCSIIELPVNKAHVWKWRREPGRQKPST